MSRTDAATKEQEFPHQVRSAFITVLVPDGFARNDLQWHLTGCEVKSVIFPALDPANHLFHFSAEAGQISGRPVGAVAVRPAAIDDKELVKRMATQVSLVYLSIRQVCCARQMASFERLRSANIQQYKIGVPAFHCLMDIPAVCFQTQKS